MKRFPSKDVSAQFKRIRQFDSDQLSDTIFLNLKQLLCSES